jgi:glycerophosphoryl diester phosphodiesterase
VGLRVIAHRGASGTCPENTLVAFHRAEALGAHMVELDVQRTRDAALVVVHDWTLDRTTDGHGAVGACRLDEIAGLDAGRWFGERFRGERVPTLGDVLAAITLPVNVELKPVGDDGLDALALAAVRAAGALGRVVFSSFDVAVLERLRGRSSEASVAVLWEEAPIAGALALAERVAARALHLRKDAATPEIIEVAHGAGLAVHVWTVNDPAEIGSLVGVGLDGVFTDFPERFLHNAPAA